MIGIYLIRCKSENKIYIGQSKNIKKRYNDHIRKLKLNIHPNCYLQEAFNKYGGDDFSCEILCWLEEKQFSRQKLYDLEIKYISEYDSTNRNKGYNIESGGIGKGRASQETCEKLRKAKTGKHLSEQTKRKMSKQKKGKPSHWKGKTQTEEHKKKRIDYQYGKVWVNNGDNSKFVTNDEAKRLISLGYSYGRPFFKRNKGKQYEYNGEFYTIPQIAEMCNLNKSVIFARIRQGWSIEKATKTPKIAKNDKIGKHFYNGEYLNLKHISKLVGIDYEILRSRLRRGMSLDEAISKPIRKRGG